MRLELSLIIIVSTATSQFACQSTLNFAKTEHQFNDSQTGETEHSEVEIDDRRETYLRVTPAVARTLEFCRDDVYSQYLQKANLVLMNKRDNFSISKESRLKHEADLATYNLLNRQIPAYFDGIPFEVTPRIYSWILYFTDRGRSEFLQWLVRSESVRPFIRETLEQEGIPSDLVYLAMIESGFSNTAFSHSAASGTWQFMKPTAKHYGLNINYWLDERRDPIKSTLAAARYLKDLKRQLQNWYLALAAYNAGPGKIVRAMQRTQSRDYWTLVSSSHLKKETKNYVPKILAALIIANQPEKFGFSITEDIRNIPPTTSIPLMNSYALSEISEKLRVPISVLRKWNPELIQNATPPIPSTSSHPYQLRLTQSLAEQFSSIVDNLIPLQIEEIQIHTVRRGETLLRIAKRYNITLKDIIKLNPSVQSVQLKPGCTLNIPVPKILAG